jgi:hypothetical protein
VSEPTTPFQGAAADYEFAFFLALACRLAGWLAAAKCLHELYCLIFGNSHEAQSALFLTHINYDPVQLNGKSKYIFSVFSFSLCICHRFAAPQFVFLLFSTEANCCSPFAPVAGPSAIRSPSFQKVCCRRGKITFRFLAKCGVRYFQKYAAQKGRNSAQIDAIVAVLESGCDRDWVYQSAQSPLTAGKFLSRGNKRGLDG